GKYKCVHGHFLPIKYLLLSEKTEVKFITWMRDPIERMLSHYHYWRRSYDPKRAIPHHKKFMEENWSLERFCLGPEFRNIYNQYLWGFPLKNFEFIGIVEHYQEDFIIFSREFLGTNLPSFQMNVSGAIGKKHPIDEQLRKKIEQHHIEDIKLYKECLRIRQNRI
ncbi:MAG: hypothetical protein R3359_10585, partial [Marinirhabdus sp.]|nr:hypothetical protein [Marinirhabdus sp.]